MIRISKRDGATIVATRAVNRRKSRVITFTAPIQGTRSKIPHFAPQIPGSFSRLFFFAVRATPLAFLVFLQVYTSFCRSMPPSDCHKAPRYFTLAEKMRREKNLFSSLESTSRCWEKKMFRFLLLFFCFNFFATTVREYCDTGVVTGQPKSSVRWTRAPRFNEIAKNVTRRTAGKGFAGNWMFAIGFFPDVPRMMCGTFFWLIRTRHVLVISFSFWYSFFSVFHFQVFSAFAFLAMNELFIAITRSFYSYSITTFKFSNCFVLRKKSLHKFYNYSHK